MTREEIKALSLEGIEERCAVILTEMVFQILKDDAVKVLHSICQQI